MILIFIAIFFFKLGGGYVDELIFFSFFLFLFLCFRIFLGNYGICDPRSEFGMGGGGGGRKKKKKVNIFFFLLNYCYENNTSHILAVINFKKKGAIGILVLRYCTLNAVTVVRIRPVELNSTVV